MIAGVAGGLAEYFDIDPSLVRIALVVLAVMSGGTAVLFYAGAWLVLPEADGGTAAAAATTAATAAPNEPRRPACEAARWMSSPWTARGRTQPMTAPADGC